MPTGSKRVYCDPSIYVEVFLGPDEPNFEIARAALLTAEQGLTEAVLSGLVMSETVGAPRLRAPQGPPHPDWAPRLARVVAYFRSSTFQYVEESRRAGEMAMDLAIGHGLKGADAMHLALAQLAGCEEFYSLDKKHLRIGDQLDGMRVLNPYGDPQSQLEI